MSTSINARRLFAAGLLMAAAGWSLAQTAAPAAPVTAAAIRQAASRDLRNIETSQGLMPSYTRRARKGGVNCVHNPAKAG